MHALQQANQIDRGVVRPVTDMYAIQAADNPVAARDAHYSGVPAEIGAAMAYINRSLYFNEITSPDGEKTNINLNIDPSGEVIRYEVQKILNQRNVVCVLPFVDKEESTIEGNVDYALEKLGEGRVLAVHSGKNRELLDRVHNRGGMAVSQDDILSCYDWERMAELNIIPPYFKIVDGVPAKGPAHRNFTKGLTMMAGAAAMEAQGVLEDTDVAWHDTDVQNPHEYDALTHLYVPDTYAGGQKIRARRVARNGEGRNNEMWQAEANQLGAASITAIKERFLNPQKENPHGISDSEFFAREKRMMELALLLANNTWPITGERAGQVRDIPFSTGMGIETLMDIYDAGLDVRDQDNTVAQIGNPNQKIENAVVDTKREWMLMNYCADFQRIVSEHIFTTGRMLHEWRLEDIRDFNNKYADMLQTYAVTCLQKDCQYKYSISCRLLFFAGNFNWRLFRDFPALFFYEVFDSCLNCILSF